MGCATSRPKVCQNCHTPYSPVRRSYSMYIPNKKDHHESEQHLVNLTSSTLGSLKLDSMNLSQSLRDDQFAFEIDDYDVAKGSKDELLIEARTWSQMINEKIPNVVVPKTPVRTPPGEPETINAWELMEGLEDITPLKPHLDHSFSFPVSHNTNISCFDDHQLKENGEGSPNMADIESSLHSNDTSILSDFDPEVISTFRKALEELPPANPFHLKPLVVEDHQGSDDEAKSRKDSKRENGEVLTECNKLVTREMQKLVIYFTSLRGVRKTYEDCCHVRVILKGLGVKVDERDVSMHSGFKEELKELLGDGFARGGLPRVFLGKKCIGGADVIRRMNEDGKLEKLVENCERIEDGDGGIGVGNGVCEACGDIRFVPCETCSGSCKIYYEGEYDELEVEDDEYGFQRCPDCNENGLIRCPICCD